MFDYPASPLAALTKREALSLVLLHAYLVEPSAMNRSARDMWQLACEDADAVIAAYQAKQEKAAMDAPAPAAPLDLDLDAFIGLRDQFPEEAIVAAPGANALHLAPGEKAPINIPDFLRKE